MVAAMTTAHITTMWNSGSNELERFVVLSSNPFNAKSRDLILQSADGERKLPLFNRHGDERIGERRTFAISDQGMKQRQAVFAARQSDSHFVPGSKHRETTHGSTYEVENFL